MDILFAIGFPGVPEMLIVAFVLLLLFGNRLPSVMRSLGVGITEFKKGIRDGDTSEDKIEEQVHSASSGEREKEFAQK